MNHTEIITETDDLGIGATEKSVACYAQILSEELDSAGVENRVRYEDSAIIIYDQDYPSDETVITDARERAWARFLDECHE